MFRYSVSHSRVSTPLAGRKRWAAARALHQAMLRKSLRRFEPTFHKATSAIERTAVQIYSNNLKYIQILYDLYGQ